MRDSYDVLISGGGPVGMGLAIELGQRGVRVCVIERHREPQRIPKGQNLTQRTGEHFKAWGCEDKVRAAHDIPKGGGIGGMTTYGTLLSDYHYDWLNRAHVKDYYFAANARLPQYATEAALRARVAEIETVDVLYGWESAALNERTDDVRLTVRDRATDASMTLSAGYVVGCDGARSFVREAAGIPEARAEHNRLMALLVFQSPALHTLLERYPGKAFYNVLHPDFDGYWQFFGRVDHGVSWFFHAPVPLGTTRDTLDAEAVLTRAVGQPFDFALEHVGLWDLRMSLADTYQAGRVFIAGDAAHSHPPYGGYGINTGFEDARNLGWKLAASLQGWGGPELLGSYTRERRLVFKSTSDDFIERFIEDDRAFLEAYRPDKDRTAFEAAWYGRNLDADEVHAFEPNYGEPPSAKGTHAFRARTGHLLAPPGAGQDARVLERLGEGFTLLSKDASVIDEVQSAANAAGIKLSVGAMEPEWAKAYEAESVLLRPDRFVAWTDGDAGAPGLALAHAAGFGGGV